MNIGSTQIENRDVCDVILSVCPYRFPRIFAPPLHFRPQVGEIPRNIAPPRGAKILGISPPLGNSPPFRNFTFL